MSKVKKTKNKIKSRVEAIKKINDNPQKSADELYDKYIKDLPSTDQLLGKKLSQLQEKRKRKKEEKKDIFEELSETVEGFLGFSKDNDQQNQSKLLIESRQKLKQHTKTSISFTVKDLKNIILESAKEVFFAGDGPCGTNRNIDTSSPINVSPKEFDLMEILSQDPSTNAGKIVYEPTSPDQGLVKMNREFFNYFSGSTFTFKSKNTTDLFDMTWNSSTQQYSVNLKPMVGSNYVKIDDFLNDYFSSIELPDITGITKTAMLMVLQGDDSQSKQFDLGMNRVERLLKKLTSICGTPKPKDLNQNPKDQFNENDEEDEFYFDFDDVEGIDLDDESARLRKVLRFRDCNNFEVPVNKRVFEDFVYLSSKKNIDSAVDKALNNAAKDAHAKSNGSIELKDLQLSILGNYIFKLPKALLSAVFSPKLVFPIVVVYKYFKSSILSAAPTVMEIIKNLKKLFLTVIEKIYWVFISNFWKLIKPELLAFLTVIVSQVLKNKYKRYVTIVTALIALLRRILETNLDNCQDLFNSILGTIESALSQNLKINIPGLLLGFADKSPGFSEDGAILNINERLSSLGINLGDIGGDENKLPKVINGMVRGLMEEFDKNSFVKTSNKEIIIPSPVGPIVIPPGIINSSGKMF